MPFLQDRGFSTQDIIHLQQYKGLWDALLRDVQNNGDLFAAGYAAKAEEGWQLMEDKARSFVIRSKNPPPPS